MLHKTFEKGVMYQIYPRSFADSNNDGIGDIQGIISKLDYLKDLGVKIIWLSPIYESPLDDMGYDISNYYKIHKDYGTMEDFDQLIIEATKRELKIVMDLVVNHTSDEHEWFKQALADPKSKYRDYYYFRPGKNAKRPPNNWDSMFTGSAWEKVPNEDNMYYLHLYSKKQPDLNYHNKEVINEVKKILNFYFDKGVYGFRCDVIDQIYKTTLKDGKFRFLNKGIEHYLCQPGNHIILKELRKEVFDKHEDSMFLGENAFMNVSQGKAFFDKELDMFISFDHMNVDKGSIPVFKKKFKPKKLRQALFMWQKEVPWNALYLENHDQLRSINRFGNSNKHYNESAKALAMLLLTLRGTPIIYEGEEIGMLNYPQRTIEETNDVAILNTYKLMRKLHFSKKHAEKLLMNINRDNARSPMQWCDEINGGFSENKPWLDSNINANKFINVQDNAADPESILNFYKKMIDFRNNSEALKFGDFIPVTSDKRVICFIREKGKDKLLITINLSSKYIVHLDFGEQILLSNYKNKSSKLLPPYYAEIKRL